MAGILYAFITVISWGTWLAPKTRAAVLTVAGCLVATGGAILLGTLK